ncbi:MAG: transporter substrate-binding domain-containing protein [Thermoanaerobaculia bacterium]|nr:transporter substrate-binding domain-containing protein [Thermoanaerobaculia bacterium]
MFLPIVPGSDLDAQASDGELPRVLEAAVLENWPPQYSVTEEREPTGFAVDIVDEVARRAGLEVRYRIYPTFPAALAALDRGEVDLIPNMGITAERQRRFAFTRPVETFSIVLFVRKEMAGISGLESLQGRPVGGVEENAALPILATRHRGPVEVYPDLRQAVVDLLTGQIDGLAYPRPVVEQLTREAGLDHRLRVAGGPLAEIKRGIAVLRTDRELRDRLDAALGELTASPRFQEIYQRWYRQPEPFWTPRRVGLSMGALLLVSLAAMGAWRYRSVVRLNKKLVASIRKRERTETMLRQKERQLAASRRLETVGRLAGGVAHDFNNILTAILGYTDLLLARLPVGDDSRREAEQIRRAAERAAALTRQLLAFGRRQVLEPERIDLNEVVREMETMLRRLVEEPIDLSVDSEPDLYAVVADPGQIEQVLMNLVVNARDSVSPEGRIEIRTANVVLDRDFVDGRPELDPGAHVLLEVRDDGPGIDADALPHIFEPFFTTKEKGQGTGLGLATVYGIVSQSDGWIEVESRPGEGAAFRVYLPRAPKTSSAEEKNKGEADTVEAFPAGRRSTILVCEDEDPVRDLAVTFLKRQGHRTLAADDGESALELAEEHLTELDLLLTDMVMPEMDGRELADHLLEHRPELPVLFMSGYTDRVALRSDREAFLPKPFTEATLFSKVEELLDYRGSRGETSGV